MEKTDANKSLSILILHDSLLTQISRFRRDQMKDNQKDKKKAEDNEKDTRQILGGHSISIHHDSPMSKPSRFQRLPYTNTFLEFEDEKL